MKEGIGLGGGAAGEVLGRRAAERPRSLPEQIADECGELIVNGAFRGGARITEQQLAEHFGVSRGPVRDAIRILEKRRLVEVRPRRGVYVRPLTLAAVKDLFDVRIALAALAARTMAMRKPNSYIQTLDRRVADLRAAADDPEADPLRFSYQSTRGIHTIVKGSGNELIADLWDDLNESSFWTTIWKVPLDATTPEVRRSRADEYAEIAAAIRAGEPDRAERAARACLQATRDAALTALRKDRPGAFDT